MMLVLVSLSFPRLLAAANYDHTTFFSPLVLGDSTRSYVITSCTFANCRNVDNIGGGLALKVNQAVLTIASSLFLNCSSTEAGGCFYVTCDSLSFALNCISTCTAKSYPISYAGLDKTASASQSVFLVCNRADCSTDASYISCPGSIQLDSLNYSANSVSTAMSVFSVRGGNSSRFLHFQNNAAGSIFHIKNDQVRGSIESSNFLTNSGSKTCIENEMMTFQLKQVFFMKDQSKYFTNRFCTFSTCVFDVTEDEVEAKLGTRAVLSDCTFSVTRNAVISIPYVAGCGAVPNQRKGLSGVAWFGIFLAIVCLVAAAYLVARKWICDNRPDTKMLMYV
jgi:hypothetical protein